MKQNILANQRTLFLSKLPLCFWEGDLERNNIKNENLMKEISISFSLPQSNGKVCFEALEINFRASKPLPFQGEKITPKS